MINSKNTLMEQVKKPFNDPVVMAILNLTPDSFSDGGAYINYDSALKRTEELISQGAHIIDVGAESTRPFAEPVSEQEEISRLSEYVSKFKTYFDVPLSIDTTKAGVARFCLEKGADIINDVSGLSNDSEMANVVAKYDATLVLMHMKESPKTMQVNPSYEDVLNDVKLHLKTSRDLAYKAGVQSVILDPGIGFGKTLEDNLRLIANLNVFLDLDCPLLIGTSRKSFIEKITGGDVTNRLTGTLISNILAFEKGASIFRVHDVQEVVNAFKMYQAIEAYYVN